MDSRIQQRIAPIETIQSKTLNDLQVGESTEKQKGDGAPEIDFRSLLLNSNHEAQLKRQAQKNGDLSGAKSYEEFLATLNSKAQKEKLPSNTLDKDDFLTLFVTQLQHQDPLNPQDGAEMASQLAQFNSLEQMLNINKTLEDVSTKTSQGHSLQFLNFIGKEVSVKDGRVKIEHGQLTQAGFKLDFPVGRARLEVRDGKGDLVAMKELGSLAQGEHALTWDGRNGKGEPVGDGIYSFAVTAYGKGDSQIPVEITSKVKVTGVDLKDEAAAFTTDLGKIGLKDIAEIQEQKPLNSNSSQTGLPGPVLQEDLTQPAREDAPSAPGSAPELQAGGVVAPESAVTSVQPGAGKPQPVATGPKGQPFLPIQAQAGGTSPEEEESRADLVQSPFALMDVINRYNQQNQAPVAPPRIEERG